MRRFPTAHRAAVARPLVASLAVFLLFPLSLPPRVGSAQEAPDEADAGAVEDDPGREGGRSDHARNAPSVRAVRLSTSITLDGRLDEAAWREAPPATGFRQVQPDEGEVATERTEVRFVYGQGVLYVGARMFDSSGGEGVSGRLVRRDADPESDVLEITFDTFHDHLGRTRFQVNPAGVRGDALGLGGGGTDSSWDPVWEVATHVDSLGWTAEMRIPLHQLRFPGDGGKTWGLQLVRRIRRLDERSQWAFWRNNESGGPSRYGHLRGLDVESVGRGLEIMPYTVVRSAHVTPSDPDNPLADPHANDFRMGGDVQYQITSNLTLDATFNPDFGQVEVDPAVVNLSAFETFFPEKRPFFVRGSGLFDFGNFWCFFCNNASSLDLFFSRRIGRSPQGSGLAHDEGEFVDVPENTTILGAARLSGRQANGFSVGLMNAVTRQENARVTDGADAPVSTVPVEPLTNYFVGRAKRDFGDGDLVVGGMVTSVYRDQETDGLGSVLPNHAESAGVDAEYWWSDREFHLLASAAVTQVGGSQEAIDRIQRSSARYFQRPDREHGDNGLFSDAYDPTVTSLRGYGLYTRMARESGDWRFETAMNLRSPGFETNDIAFLTRTDFAWMNANVMRLFTTPGSWYQSLTFIGGAQQEYNWDGDLRNRDVHAFFGWTTPDFWHVNAFWIRNFQTSDDRRTRGGPAVRSPASHFVAMNLSTNSRKPVVVGTHPSWSRTEEGYVSWRTNLSLRLKPASNISFSLSPSFRRSESSAQFVTSVDDPTANDFSGSRYVFADLVQRTLSMTTRADVTFTPDLSFQLFLQPFVGTGDFTNFKEFAAPGTLDKQIYGRDVGAITSEITEDGKVYHVDPDAGGPAESFSFEDPNFNLRSLRGNAVLRWQWRPGSTLFLVWTQERSERLAFGDLDFGRDVSGIFEADADDIFMVKMSYWLGM